MHNFFLQYLIEVGIVGFLVFMGFILFIFYKFSREYLKRETDDYNNGFFYLIIALSILVHSLLDFNLSFAFMGMLVFLALGEWLWPWRASRSVFSGTSCGSEQAISQYSESERAICSSCH